MSRVLTDLIRRAKMRDEDARRELFALFSDNQAFGKALTRFVRRKFPADHPGRRGANTEDIVHSGLASALGKIEKLRGDSEGELLVWLRWILVEKIRKHRRSSSRLRDGDVDVEDEAPSVEDVVIDAELQDLVFAACSELPLAERIAVELRLEGLTTAECAKVLDLRPNTFLQRETRALKRLREYFERRFPEDTGGATTGDETET